MSPPPDSPVLLVDDEPANLLALEAVLGELGGPLVRAGSGPQALKALQDTDFAAILLDVRMPGMDGFETARLIRSRPRSRTTPILFVTASDSTEVSIEAAYSLGAVDFLTKPLMPAALKAKVLVFMELHRSKEELHAAQRRALNESAFLSAILEAVEDGIVACDAQGALTLFNRATRELYGFAERPLAPQQWTDQYRLFRPDGVTPLPLHEIPLFRALSGERVRNAEMVATGADGQVRLLRASGQPLRDDNGRPLGAVVSMHDITADRESGLAREAAVREQVRRQEAEAAAERMRASEERYRALFESIDEGFCLIEMLFDRKGRPCDYRFVETNPAFQFQTGLNDAVGKTILELVPGHDSFWFETYGRVLATGEPARFIHEAKAMGRWFDVYASRLGNPESRTVAVLFSDISERRRAEDDLRRMAAELAEVDRRKTEFLATLAHELRNPLAPLRNGLHLLRLVDSPSPTFEKTRAMMDRQVSHMVRLIDDLLDIARISSGKVEIRKKRVALKTVVEEAVETSLPLIEAARHRLSLRVSEENLWLDADAARLSQVLSNLLNNAAKYTPAGGRIELVAARDAADVVLAVSDTGMGIPQESLPHVFQMFTQVARNMERSHGGLGVGLSLVHGLVQLHGGTVTVSSAGAGQGSRFEVRLPLAASDAPDLDPAVAAPTPVHAPNPGFRVLVVDDNSDAAESLAVILQMKGHLARVAHDGGQAVHVAREFLPDIVFLDIGMPGKDGYEVARDLRRTAGMEQAVLVALTGWGSENDRTRTRNAGFDHHLTKPAELAAVERLLSGLAPGAQAVQPVSWQSG